MESNDSDDIVDAEFKEVNSFDVDSTINSDILLNNPIKELIDEFKKRRVKSGKHKNGSKRKKKK